MVRIGGRAAFMRGTRQYWRKILRQISLRKFAIAISTVAFAALFSISWSEQRGISLSVESAQARTRIYVQRYYYNPYREDLSGLSWYAVRAYYAGGPWSGNVGGWPWTYAGWEDYAQRNGIGCVPGTVVKGGDGIDYVCQ
jgi:hypothetical protein